MTHARRLIGPAAVVAAPLLVVLATHVSRLAVPALLAALVLTWTVLHAHTSVRLWLFLLTSIPIARVAAGGVPLYLIDLVLVGAVAGLALRRLVRQAYLALPRRTRLWLLVYPVALLLPLVVQVSRTSFVAESAYGFFREMTAFSAVLVGAYLGLAEHRARRAVDTIGIGATVGSLVALAQRLPLTSPFVTDALSAVAPGIASGAARTYPDRSTAFMAAPTALSGFLCIALLLLVFRPTHRRRRLRLRTLPMLVIMAGLLSTYSRQWIPAFAIAVVMTAVMTSGATKRHAQRVLSGIAMGAALLLTLGPVDPDYFVDRVTALGGDDANVTTRLERQGQFVGNLVTEPGRFVVGEGFALQDIGLRQATQDDAVESTQRLGYSDNSFLLELGNRGALAAAAYVAIIFGTLRLMMRGARRRVLPADAIGTIAALVAAVLLHLFDNYFSEAMFMRMVLWLLIGLGAGAAARAAAPHAQSIAPPQPEPVASHSGS
jgi:hypothetical protein